MKRNLLTFLCYFCTLLLFSQGTVSDYKRAFSYPDSVRNKVFYSDVAPRWIEKTNKFWYVRHTPKGDEYVLVDVLDKDRTMLFNRSKLATKLSRVTAKKVDSLYLSLPMLNVSENVDTFRFVLNNAKYVYVQSSDTLFGNGESSRRDRGGYWGTVNTEKIGGAIVSPDKKMEVFVRDNNLYVRYLISNEEKALTSDGTSDTYYSVYPVWSHDSKKIIVSKLNKVNIRTLTLIESSPSDQLQPKMRVCDYVKPGDSLATRIPVIIDVQSAEKRELSLDLFKNQYYLDGYEWSSDSKTVTFEYNERGHKVYRVLEASAATGKVRTLIEETSKTFVNYSRRYRKDLLNTNEIIWMSERDNWNHLYLYDRVTGNVKNQITKGQWYVREVVDVNEKRREIIFSANGMVPGEDPYLIRYYRVRFDGSGLKCLTPDEGMHRAWFSDSKKYLVDVYSLVNKAPVAVLREAANGKVILSLEQADISALLKTGWKAPEPFVAKGRDGKTDIWGVVIRPTNFDPTKKYPVLEYIYAGPGDQYTPKAFFTSNRYLNPIAELGFIVIQLDGMGTSYRSKAFEEVCYKNLKDAGFPDRIAWTNALGKKYNYVDTTRIGIFGASAGGQESMTGLLFYPEHYKAAYSSCGCHDNRMDKIWWNEQWMGYPIDPSYVTSSNVENAARLSRPLMLVVGELDNNVDPSSTYQVCNALIKTNKDFELVVIPGAGHTMGDEYGEHKRYDFFVKHLIGITPPAWSNFKK
ncbi:MAG: DPP IV N-terminal domain-containing protein [Paludibacteraceae bacterium]